MYQYTVVCYVLVGLDWLPVRSNLIFNYPVECDVYTDHLRKMIKHFDLPDNLQIQFITEQIAR